MHSKNNNKGFTLAELLIVVAIIAVLVAISIPIFSSQLKKARLAVDQANVRSAKAAAATDYMTEQDDSSAMTYIYDGSRAVPVTASNVSEVSKITSASGYGKSEKKDNEDRQTGAIGTPKNGYVEVTVNSNPEQGKEQITARWVSGAAVFNSDSGDLILTGNVISNGSIMDQIKSLGIEPSKITTITAADGSKIDDYTDSVFKDLNNLKTIDLSKATLEHSSYHMYLDMPASVQKIVLPQCTSGYNIYGIWYDKDGKRLDLGNWAPQGESKSDYSRIDENKFKGGDSIYRTPNGGKS